MDTIDSEGFRENVGIIITNDDGGVLLAGRIGRSGWQFPQGGIKAHETPQEAMLRELREELGLLPDHVEIVGSTRGWLRYRLPRRYIRRHASPVCIGQKQVWFLLHLVGDETSVQLDATNEPEFDHWKWVSPRVPPREVIYFKRHVYRRALKELIPLIAQHRASAIAPALRG